MNKEAIRQAWRNETTASMTAVVESPMNAPDGVKIVSRGFDHNGLHHVILDGHVVANVSYWGDEPRVTFWSKADSIAAFNARRQANRERAVAYARARKEAIRLRDSGQLDRVTFIGGQEGGVFRTSLGDVSACKLIGETASDALCAWDGSDRKQPPPVDGYGDVIADSARRTVMVTVHAPRSAGELKDHRALPVVDQLPW